MREIGGRIIKQVRKGNGSAFKKLVEHYHQSVYQICYLIMGDDNRAEELAKNTFLHVYYHSSDCQAINKKFSLGLFQITVILAQSQLSERKQSGVDVGPVYNEKKTNEVTSLLMNVSLNERLALILKSSDHLSIQEISGILQIPDSDTITYIWRGRETIRREMISYIT